MLVRPSELPAGEWMEFRNSSYFIKNNVDLPSPEDVRQQGAREDEGPVCRGEDRPRAVVFKELGLLAKYGTEITIAEAQCLWFFNRHLKNKVPTPELFVWRHDDNQVFIYMQLVQGDTLEQRWPSLSTEERRSICRELKGFVETWRGLQQETQPYFIGKATWDPLGYPSCLLTTARPHRRPRSRRHHLQRCR